MHKRFEHKEIEKKWEDKWTEEGLYHVGERDESKEKEYFNLVILIGKYGEFSPSCGRFVS